jgi:hypothetical protein
MWHPFGKKDESESTVTSKCNEHSKLIRIVYRIEGENAVIIVLLSVIIVIILKGLS